MIKVKYFKKALIGYRLVMSKRVVSDDEFGYYLRNNENIKYSLHFKFRIAITCDYIYHKQPNFSMYRIIQLDGIDIFDDSIETELSSSDSDEIESDGFESDQNDFDNYDLYYLEEKQEKGFDCPICYEKKYNSVKCLKCKNIFCKECDNKWDRSKGCPYCRSK